MNILLLLLGIGCLVGGGVIFVKWIRLWKKEGMPHASLKAPEKLITYGVYAHVRHPHYLSHMLFSLGVSLLLLFFLLFFDVPLPWSALPFLLPTIWIPGLALAAAREERQLIEKFGEEYEEYKKKTAMFISRVV